MLHSLPFGKFQTRLGIAKVLGYYGFRPDVYTLMQKLSHQTRAFIINAKGLKGFVVPFNVIEFLENTDDERFNEVTQHQHVKKKSVIKRLRAKRSDGERLEYLKSRYPCLFIFALKFQRNTLALQGYTDFYFSFRDRKQEIHNYSWYVHGHWLPTLQRWRQEGKLSKGTLKIVDFKFAFGREKKSYVVTYCGELDEKE